MVDRRYILREWVRRELESIRRTEHPAPEERDAEELYERILKLIDRYSRQ